MKRNGFTLIELLAVILILGIIALIAIPTVTSVVEQSRKGSSENTGMQIVNSTEQYYITCELNGGNDKNGNKCTDNLKTTAYSSAELSELIGIKGDFPNKEDIVVYKKNTDGTVAFVYRKDTFACTNQVDESGNVLYKYTGINNPDGVKCDKKRINSTGSVMLQTDGTKHHLKSYYDYENKKVLLIDFKSDEYRDKIYEIEFTNYIRIPNGAISWDLSDVQDKSIMGWLEDIDDSGELKKLYIGSKGDIYANVNSLFWFYKMQGLTKISFNNYYTDDVVTMASMFRTTTSLKTLDVGCFDTSNVTNMNYMFAGDSSNALILEKIDGLDSFDTKKVTNMAGMFYMNTSLKTIDVSSFDTSSVTTFSSMFAVNYGFSSSLEEIKGLKSFNTKNVTNMGSMFYNNSSLKEIDLSGFDTSSVTNMGLMFFMDASLNTIDISSFDTSNVTDMRWLFASCNELTTIYVGSKWNTAKVTSSTDMFDGDAKLVGATSYNSSKKGIEMANTTTGYLTLKR